MDFLYEMMYKRQTIRNFDAMQQVSRKELKIIKSYIEKLVTLDKQIKVRFEIMKIHETTAKRGEYALVCYSENKPYYLENVGYLLAQIDLFLALLDIGVCWHAAAKPYMSKVKTLDFVMMFTFGKVDAQAFRQSMQSCKRKDVSLVWHGVFNERIKNDVRYAPSACNLQPWRVESDHQKICVYYHPPKARSAMVSNLPFYNRIDMGIFLLFLELHLRHEKIIYERELWNSPYLLAIYHLK